MERIEEIRTLIRDYKFYPVGPLSRRSAADCLFILAGFDLSLIRDLIIYTGFQLSECNEEVMEKLLSNPVSTKTVSTFLSVGFHFTDLIIKRTIAWGKAYSLSTLLALVDSEKLRFLVHDTVNDIFGPFLSRESSLNVPWNPQALHRVMHVFNITDTDIEKALLVDPTKFCTMDKPYPHFPVTRPYYKSRPYPLWHWVFDTFGPHHRLTMACFDDALSRAVSDGALHILLETFIGGGVVMRPRHVRILACRYFLI